MFPSLRNEIQLCQQSSVLLGKPSSHYVSELII